MTPEARIYFPENERNRVEKLLDIPGVRILESKENQTLEDLIEDPIAQLINMEFGADLPDETSIQEITWPFNDPVYIDSKRKVIRKIMIGESRWSNIFPLMDLPQRRNLSNTMRELGYGHTIGHHFDEHGVVQDDQIETIGELRAVSMDILTGIYLIGPQNGQFLKTAFAAKEEQV